MIIKRLIAILISILLIMTIVSGCNKELKKDIEINNESKPEVIEKSKLRIGTLKGPTGMGMSYMMEMDEKGESKIDYNFTVMGAPDQLTSDIINKSVDIAAIPTNLAAILHEKTKGDIILLGVNTLGVLYLL